MPERSPVCSRRVVRWVPLLLSVASCLVSTDPHNPILVTALTGDTLVVAPGDTVQLRFRAARASGAAIVGGRLQWTVEGSGAGLRALDTLTGLGGMFGADWTVGTDASEPKAVRVAVGGGANVGRATVVAVLRPTVIGSVRFLDDSAATRLSVPIRPAFTAVDPFGNRFQPSGISFRSSDTTIATVDSAGLVAGRRRGTVRIIGSVGEAADTLEMRIFQVPADIVTLDTIRLYSLGERAAVPFAILSDSGQRVLDTVPTVATLDTGIVALTNINDSLLQLTSRAIGVGSVELVLGQARHELSVVVAQRSRRLSLTPAGPLVFQALQDSVPLTVQAFDSLGVLLAAPSLTFSSTGSALAVNAEGMVRSEANGSAWIRVQEAGGASDSVWASVAQVADSLEVFLTDTLPIVLRPAQAPFPVACRALDRNHFPLPGSPSAQSAQGTVAGTTCATLEAAHTGFDTLRAQAGSLQRSVPFVLALPPVALSPDGDPIVLDSLPTATEVWAPTLYRDPAGRLVLYFAGYAPDSAAPSMGRSHLHRLVSTDGGDTFRYDGIALTRDSIPCSPRGDGIENIAIVPRSDAPGWRMYLAAGGFTCYGWQVFSATSPDQAVWTMEPGVRLGNGAPLPPAPPQFPPWPAGEGMVVDRMPSGDWRMLAGTYEPLTPREDKFQITEWRSPDQVQWTYVGARLTTRQVGSEADRSVYSPTITSPVPGLYRMIFTGDNLATPGGHSRIYTAVSLDLTRWQVEGALIADDNYDFFYSSLVDDLLVFIRRQAGQPDILARTGIQQP